MYKYVGDVSEIAHNLVNTYVKDKNIAVDCTLGNGFDCDFLCENFKKVYAFDIQQVAIDNYEKKGKKNVTLISDSHHNIEHYVSEEIDLVMYNLGFLPGGDKCITTMSNTTLASINSALKLLKAGGLITIAVYIGHEEGKRESENLLNYLSSLAKKDYAVMVHSYLNRSKNAPYLIVIEKNINI